MQHQLRRILPTVVLVGGLAGAIVVAGALISHGSAIRFQDLTRDPNSILGAPFYVGILSQLGILLWGATATVCLFTAHTLRSTAQSGFLWHAGVLTLALTLVDLLQLHESDTLELAGGSELLVVAAICSWALVVFWRYRTVVRGSDYLVLVLSLAFGSISVLMDSSEFSSGRATFVEDGAKLLAISFWLLYFWRFGRQAIRGRLSSESA